MGSSQSSPPPPPPPEVIIDRGAELTRAQDQAINQFFRSVEDVVFTQPQNLNDMVDNLRRVATQDYLNFQAIARKTLKSIKQPIHFSPRPGIVIFIPVIVVYHINSNCPGIIALFLKASAFYQADEDLLNSLRNDFSQFMSTWPSVANSLGFSSSAEVQNMVQNAVNLMFESAKVAPSNIAGQGVYKFVHYIPIGVIAGMYYSVMDGCTGGGIFIATSKDLVVAATKTDMQVLMINDFQKIIKDTKDTLDSWEKVEQDRNRMVPVSEFNQAVYEQLISQMTTDLMKLVVSGFWISQQKANTTNVETTNKWNNYLCGGDVDVRVSRMKEAYKARYEELNKYFQDFVVKK